jgi:tetratricopeptide (TPR) repeat protein
MLVMLAIMLTPAAKARAERCVEPVGRVIAVDALIEVSVQADWQSVQLGAALCVGDILRAGDIDRAAVRLDSGVAIQLGRGTTARIIEASTQGRTVLGLISGIVRLLARQPRALEVETRFANAAVEGTEFVVQAESDRMRVAVLEGRVRVTNPLGAIAVGAGRAAVAVAGRAPELELRVNPRDAVQWILYFPPLGTAPLPPDAPAPLREAARQAREGERDAAWASLERVPASKRGTGWQTLRAELLLAQGSTEEALAAIGAGLRERPDDTDALALRSIVAVARNDADQALTDASRAVELAPGNARARLALSYAAQAAFDLPLALTNLEAAVDAAPDNALAWARLAEAQLMTGDRRAADRSAAQAAAIDPGNARAQAVEGFAALTRIDTRAAKAAFTRALELDSFNPLARLGLGLATIRGGDLVSGREQIELAVMLDPDNALLRSYLGKAYLEERRSRLAGDELALAKDLGPNDPTPWFYDAIRKQLANRPVEALRDLERSIALNDDRAVYRSRLLLDADRADRTVSLARIYDDLGFQQLGRLEATRSLAIDPANASAHRFLADIYATQPRSELARVSELLQAQLLSPVGVNLIQPRLLQEDYNLVRMAGPTRLTFNEFNPLFERNGFTAAGTIEAGSWQTRGAEIAASGLIDRWSLNAGGFGYATEGWRKNADVERDGVVAIGQYQPWPELGLQVEARRDGVERGDVIQTLDRELNPNSESDVTNEVLRFGAHWSPAPGSHTLLSLISGRRRTGDDEVPIIPTAAFNGDGRQLEVQQQQAIGSGHLVAGANVFDLDERTSMRPPRFGERKSRHGESRFVGSYAYWLQPIGSTLDTTLGLEANHIDRDDPDFAESNLLPKFGLAWHASPNLTVRAATFGVAKPPLSVNQTIQPTQVSGFNQLYDDVNGTRSRLYGIGIDYRPAENWALGLEGQRRNVSETFPFRGQIRHGENEEDEARAYLYWTPSKRLALSVGLLAERYHSDMDLTTLDHVYSFATPIAARYFHPSGVIGYVGANPVRQRLSRDGEDNYQEDAFVTFDAGIGYRLPGYRGIISLEVTNILDNKFRHMDENYRSVEEREARLAPERQVLFRLTLGL